MLDHQDKYMMKAQVNVSKSSAIFDVQPLPQRKHYCQIYQVVKHMLRGRLLVSFQDREHEGGDTRSQDGIKDNDSKIKIQDHSMQMFTQLNSQDHKAQSFKKSKLNGPRYRAKSPKYSGSAQVMEMIRLSCGIKSQDDDDDDDDDDQDDDNQDDDNQDDDNQDDDNQDNDN
uniref:Uncharacterized protein n=1 Tax=Tanacetum cinerariifolium TaxID=118510 RepID=A0A699L7Y4_TANCI|nr:hypothetical protein [Tanacetum cinerariifolium]